MAFDRRRAHRARAGAWTLALIAVAGAAHAQSAADRETARALMDDGFARRDAMDHSGALERFEAADALMHVPSTSMEAARSQLALGLLVEARDRLQTLLRLAPKPGEPTAFAEARAEAQSLSSDLAVRIPSLKLTLRGVPAGQVARVSVDGADVPAATLIAPRKLNPGVHIVVARLGAREVKEQTALRERDTKELLVDFSAAREPIPNATIPPPSARESAPSRTPRALAYLGLGVAGGAIVAGTVAGVVAVSDKNAAKSGCTADNRCPPSTYANIDGARTAGSLATAAFLVAGVAGAAGVVGWVLTREPTRTTGATASPWIGPGSAGVTGRF